MAVRLDTEAKQGLRLISPTFAYVLVMLAAPLVMVLLFSFWTQDYLAIDTTPTLNNYREAWGTPLYQVLLWRSLKISVIVTVVTVLLAFPVAYFLSFHVQPSRKSLWLFLITIPFWTSYLIRVFLWKVILGYNGVLNSSLQGLGIIDEPLTFILYNANAVVITLVATTLMFSLILYYGARVTYSEWYWEETTPGLGNPAWIYTIWMPILCVAILMRVLGRGWAVLIKRRGARA